MARTIQSRDVVDLKLAAGGWVNVCRANAEFLNGGRDIVVQYRTALIRWRSMERGYKYKANMKFRAQRPSANQPKEIIMSVGDKFRVNRTAPVVLMTLFKIYMLPYALESQSELAALEHLLKEGLVEPNPEMPAANLSDREYTTTERGKAHIKMLCAMEPPVESAVWRHSVTLEVIED